MITIGFLRRWRRRNRDQEYLISKGMSIGKNCNIYSWQTIDHTYPHLLTIGDDVIVGAGSVVVKPIPPYSLAVGCPAKVIKKREG